jgi:hypothetical protein
LRRGGRRPVGATLRRYPARSLPRIRPEAVIPWSDRRTSGRRRSTGGPTGRFAPRSDAPAIHAP